MSDALATGEADLWLSSGDTKQVRRKFSLYKNTWESSQGVQVAGVSDVLAELCSGNTK